MKTKCPVCTTEMEFEPAKFQVLNSEVASVIVSPSVRITCSQCGTQFISAFDQRTTIVFGWIQVPDDKKVEEKQKRHIIVPTGTRLFGI